MRKMDLPELLERAEEIFAMPHNEKDDAEWGFCEADEWLDTLKYVLDLWLTHFGEMFDHWPHGTDDHDQVTQYEQVKAMWDLVKAQQID